MSSDAVLPPNWFEAKDEGGNTYYFNESTGETSWEFPVDSNKSSSGSGGPESHLNLPPGWAAVTDEQGNIYYYNEATDETAWEPPTASTSSKLPPRPSFAPPTKTDSKTNSKKNTSSSTTSKLPLNWVECTSDDGIYYYNEITNETSWDFPTGGSGASSSSSSSSSSLPPNWSAVTDEQGNTYYYNEVTNETSWDFPSSSASASPSSSSPSSSSASGTGFVLVGDLLSTSYPKPTMLRTGKKDDKKQEKERAKEKERLEKEKEKERERLEKEREKERKEKERMDKEREKERERQEKEKEKQRDMERQKLKASDRKSTIRKIELVSPSSPLMGENRSAGYKRLYDQYTQVETKLKAAEQASDGMKKMMAMFPEGSTARINAETQLEQQNALTETLRIASSNLQIKLNEMYQAESAGDSSYQAPTVVDKPDIGRAVSVSYGNSIIYTSMNLSSSSSSYSSVSMASANFSSNGILLPTNWNEYNDEQGNIYYYNEATDETSWDLPTDKTTNLPPNWKEYKDETGIVYYFNEVTNDTSWDLPGAQKQEVVKVKKSQNRRRKTTQSRKTST